MNNNLPLYQEASCPSQIGEGNAGLWYDKFCRNWNEDWSLEASNKLKWIKTVRKVGDNSLLQESWERTARLIENLEGKICFFRTRSRFVTGLGRDNPVENGFTWHYTLGVPYLPGSSVKGLVRDWAADSKDVERICGSAKGEKRVGTVIFFPALPLGKVSLEADVMTPHYGPYYQGKEPPADWHSPVPIPFLTVAPGQVFAFPLALRRPGESKDLELAVQWLEEALEWLGAGAKTAVGYGRFQRDKKMEERMERERQERIAAEERKRRLEEMPPRQREMEEQGFSTDPDRFMEALSTIWLPKLDEEGLAPEERREIASLLAQWYQENKPAQWKKPKSKKDKVKVAKIKRVLNEG